MKPIEENTLDQAHPLILMDKLGLYEDSSIGQFDDILDLACFVTGCSSAYISIIYEGIQNISYAKNFDTSQHPLSSSICKLPVAERRFLQIDDLEKHPQLKNTILDEQKRFAFYAGLPIVNKKDVLLGTLCVLDSHTRTLSLEQQTIFQTLGNQVLKTLELQKRNSQKKKSEQAKEESAIFWNATSSLMCILTDRLEIKVINNAAYDVFGFEPEECIGLNIANFIVPEDRLKVVELASALLKNGLKTLEIETRIVTKSNSVKWISWNAVTKNRKWFVAGRDVTHEKEASKNLLQLSTVATQIGNGVVISNAKNEVSWINPAVTEITGYSLCDFTGKRLGDVLAGEETNQETVETARKNTDEKKSFSAEFLAYRKNGQKIWLSVHNTVILDNAGEIDSLVEIIIDVTERKESEKQLELLSLVASKTNNGVSICDENGNVTWINESLENILGFKNEDVVGKKLVDFVKFEDTDMDLLEIVREKVKRFEPFNIEHKVRSKDGRILWISVANTPIHDKNTNQHTQIEIINDITKRKNVEFQLSEQREESLRLSKAKESFVSVMSHEIRTPLNAVIGLANILHDEEKLPSQEQSIDLLKFSADNLLSLINDVLDFNKIEVGKMELENKRVDIAALIKDIVASMRFKADEKSISLDYDIDANIPELVRGDKTKLFQILANLINNAIKFTDIGKVTVSVDLLPQIQNKVVLAFKITDTGIGIPADKIDAVFEPFTQAASNISRKYGGSGLGLSITQKLVSLFGGTIEVKSQVDVGTEFSFILQFNKFEGDIIKPEIKEKIMLEGNILVVDDNEINTLLAKRVLSKFGLSITTTSSGKDAIELLKSKDFDVVLMDVHMPEMDGYQTTRHLRSIDDDYYKKLPIIALTASILDDGLDDIEKAGMNDFQLKPFKPDELANMIAKYLKKNN